MNPTKSQKSFHDQLAQIGCIACRIDGRINTHISIHHIDGRTKPNAHWLVLPLCGRHHQDQGIHGVIAVHPWKRSFEAKYGNQYDLLEMCKKIIEQEGL